MICGAVNIAVVRRGSLTDRNWRKPSARHDDNYIHRPTAVTYMVAAGRFLVEPVTLLYQLPTLDFAIAGFKVELMADDLRKVIHSTDRTKQVGRIHNLDRTLFRFLPCTANQPFEGHAVEHDIIIVNLTVGAVPRGKIASFTLNANNLIQHFLTLFPLGLFSFLPAFLFFVLFGQVQGLPAFVTIIKL